MTISTLTQACKKLLPHKAVATMAVGMSAGTETHDAQVNVAVDVTAHPMITMVSK